MKTISNRLIYITFVIFAVMGLLNDLCGQNLISNPGFEEDNVSPYNLPDYYRPRTVAYHSIETNSANVYEGNKCALFNNDTETEAAGYYYANYTADGSTIDFPYAESGCQYELSIKYRTDTSFTGSGVRLQLSFACNDISVGRVDSPSYTSTTWDTITVRGYACGKVNQVTAEIYFTGKGKAWVDNVSLTKINTPLCRNGSFEINEASPTSEPDFFKPRYTSYHFIEDQLENTYLGTACALLDRPDVNTSFFQGPYDDSGSTKQYIPVCPGDTYKISAFGRVDSDFSGSGLKIAFLTYIDGTYYWRTDSQYYTSNTWEKMTHNITIPQNANNMMYSIESVGMNAAWVDEVKLERDNLGVNSSFETDSASPTDKPDYWHARENQYHSVETNAANVYIGNQCALFNNTSASPYACYYYGPYDSTGSTPKEIDVIPGEEYTISAYVKVDSNFSGSGVFLSILFKKDGTYVGRANTSCYTPASWTKVTQNITVPANVNQMLYSIEYNGINKAWVDKFELRKIGSPWYYVEAPINSLDNLSFTAPSKLSLSDMINKFNNLHAYYENNLNEDGSWGVGYGELADNHPLVRCVSNAVMGYIHAYQKIENQTFLDRAEGGLNWLLDHQLENGAFAFYNRYAIDYSEASSMYTGGLAGAALIAGYLQFNDQDYLNASNDLCDYFITIDPSSNANYNGFAIWALCENYKVTNTQSYLDKAIELADYMLAYQLDSGMWMDYHNQYIYYHGILTKSIAHLVEAIPATNPKKVVYENALFKAMNHLRRSELSTGKLIAHPIAGGERFDPYCVSAVNMVYGLLGWNGSGGNPDLSDSINTLTHTSFTNEVVQGYDIEAAGKMLDLAY